MNMRKLLISVSTKYFRIEYLNFILFAEANVFVQLLFNLTWFKLARQQAGAQYGLKRKVSSNEK